MPGAHGDHHTSTHIYCREKHAKRKEKGKEVEGAYRSKTIEPVREEGGGRREHCNPPRGLALPHDPPRHHPQPDFDASSPPELLAVAPTCTEGALLKGRKGSAQISLGESSSPRPAYVQHGRTSPAGPPTGQPAQEVVR